VTLGEVQVPVDSEWLGHWISMDSCWFSNVWPLDFNGFPLILKGLPLDLNGFPLILNGLALGFQ